MLNLFQKIICASKFFNLVWETVLLCHNQQLDISTKWGLSLAFKRGTKKESVIANGTARSLDKCWTDFWPALVWLLALSPELQVFICFLDKVAPWILKWLLQRLFEFKNILCCRSWIKKRVVLRCNKLLKLIHMAKFSCFLQGELVNDVYVVICEPEF